MKLTISAAPHLRTRRTTRHIMLDVLLSLLPATAAGIVYFGWEAAVTIALSLAGAFLTEFLWVLLANCVWRAPKETLRTFARQFDGTSLVTGLLLALCLPASAAHWYMPLLGSVFAVGAVKMLFGGTGKNIVNPAIAGRIFLFLSFAAMTVYPAPAFGAIGNVPGIVTGATQLQGMLAGGPLPSSLDLFLGTGVAGCIGETCKLALLAGAIYLCARGAIKWYLPLLAVACEGLFAVALEGFDFSYFLPSVLSGGLLLGFLFMATDYVTTPKSRLGNLIYFAALGLLTAGLRKATGYEVVSFCILLMNFTVFLIDMALPVRPFGGKAKRRGRAREDRS